MTSIFEQRRVHVGRNFQPHRLGPLPRAQPRLDRPQHVVGLLLQQVDVHVAREAERGVVDDVVAAEQIGQPAGDQVFEQHEVLLVVRLDRHEPRQHLRHLHDGEQPLAARCR